jgi:hypothetical protein
MWFKKHSELERAMPMDASCLMMMFDLLSCFLSSTFMRNKIDLCYTDQEQDELTWCEAQVYWIAIAHSSIASSQYQFHYSCSQCAKKCLFVVHNREYIRPNGTLGMRSVCGWYARSDNNGWRPIAERILLDEDPITTITRLKRTPLFHYNPAVRR